MYNFVDINSYDNSKPLPSEAVFFNGKCLDTELTGFKTLYVEGRESLENKFKELAVSNLDGSSIVAQRVLSRTLVIGFELSGNTSGEFEENYRSLARLLQTREDAKWSFNDELSVYYLGRLKTIPAPEAHTIRQIMTMEIYCADPYKYSVFETEFQLSENKMFTIINNGAVAVPIRYEVTFPSDCGFVAFISKDGVLELGSREEADREATSGDEKLVKWSDFLNAGYDRSNFDHYVSAGDFREYRYPHDMKKVTDKGWGEGAVSHDWLELDASKGAHDGSWICGSKKTVTIPNDSNGDAGALNWTTYFFNWFETTKMGQTGEQSVGIYDTNGDLLGQFGLYKVDTAGNQVVVSFTTKGGCVRTFNTTGGYWEPYGAGNRGHGRITKRDDWIEFFFDGSYYRYHDPGLKTRKAAKITICIADNLSNSKPVTLNRIADVDFTKFGVVGSADVANTFGSSRPLVVDGEAGKTYIGNEYRPDIEILGSEYIKANPGTNEIELALSSWFTGTVEAKALIREAWL